MGKRKLLLAVVGAVWAFLLSGCSATLQGIRTDLRDLQGSFHNLSYSSDRRVSPEEMCELVHQQEGGPGAEYRRCLRRQIRANLSEEDLHKLRYAKAFPGCTKTYRNPRASLQQYESCQLDAYVSEQEARIVRRREVASVRWNGGRSTARHSSRNVGR